MTEWLNDNSGMLVSYAVRTLGVLIALWLSFKVGAWLEVRVRNGLRARKFDEALSIFFGNFVRWLFIISAVLACLGVFGIQTTSFAALIGAAGLAIGLAFQGTLSNFAAGVMLLTFRPFAIGEYVCVGEREGTVCEIRLFVTTIDTLDNRRIIIPNSAVVGATIENRSHHRLRRCDVPVGVSYGADLDRTREVLDRAAANVPGRDPEAGHQIFLAGLGSSSVDWQVRVWCKPAEYWDVWDATVRASKVALDDAGLAIPFPQLDLHVKELPSRLRDAA